MNLVLHLHIYTFTSVAFPVFVGVVAVIYRFVPPQRRALLLVMASYLLYFQWNHRMALLLLVATIATYVSARSIDSIEKDRLRSLLAALMVGALIVVLVLFKASPFIIDFLRRAVSHPTLELIVPLGISYYTFKLVGYLMDVYWKKIPAERRFLPFAAYVAFFPQIVAGPIQRAETFLTQIEVAPPVSLSTAVLGVQRILLGLFKKFIVADNIGLLVNFVYQHLHASGTPVAIGFYGYPLQLYADFSGLTDIAIGAALLLGLESPENFNAPFAATNIAEYWRRWHITFTQWLTDYVFTPLRMGVRTWGNTGLVFSIFANMILIGLWHGFRWTFFMFGVVHAIYLSCYALTSRFRKRFYQRHRKFEKVTDWIGPIITFHLVAIGTVFFRAETVTDAFYCLAHLFQGFPQVSPDFQALCNYWGRALVAGIWGYGLAEIGDYLRRRHQTGEVIHALPRWGRLSIYSWTAATIIIVVVLMGAAPGSASPFMYEIF